MSWWPSRAPSMANKIWPGGSFDSLMSFMQSLTEAVRRSSNSLLLISIPESEREAGGEGGHEALERLTHTIGRIDSVWKPVTAMESFEIVRRRLFTPEVDAAARDAVLREFRDMYRKGGRDFPQEAAEGGYMERMRAAYPVHPELFQRLYEDWSTLERFQRTRGVLRMMASTIHYLWASNDQSLLIMPGSIPLHDESVRNEMLRYLPENWPAIIETDIDGEASRPFQLDTNISALGKFSASRRVARSIFIGSAPSERSQRVRGIDELRIRLATLQPGEAAAPFNDALRRMSNELTYLYADGSRYWYDTRPTVNRIARERAQGIAEADLYQQTIARLRDIEFPQKAFAAYQVAPASSADVPDEQRVRIVLLGPEHTHRLRDQDSAALQEARQLLENRGKRAASQPQHAGLPRAGRQQVWRHGRMRCEQLLAWQSIERDTEILNLDAHQLSQVNNALAQSEQTLESRLPQAWCWLITPGQSEASEPVAYEAQRLSARGNLYEAAANRLRRDAMLVKQLSPDVLLMELERVLWPADKPHLGVRQLWEFLTRYCYLPRLFDNEVLVNAIREGVERSDPAFGFATMVTETGYRGLVLGKDVTVYFDNSSVIVRREHANEVLEREDRKREAEDEAARTDTTDRSPLDDIVQPPPPPPRPPRLRQHYYGHVALDPMRAHSQMTQIVEEVLQHLTGLTGADVELTLNIQVSRPQGFDEETMRTVSENGNTLRFTAQGFE